MDILYITAPAWNEEGNIRSFVEQWYPVVEKHRGGGLSRLVVTDDGSTDRTHEILEKLAAERPLLEVLRKENGGHGPAVIYGYRYALRKGADYIFQTDTDGQTDPADFEPFWARRKACAAVFGFRPERGDGAMRAFVERVLCLIVRICFGVSLPDVNAPYRLMSADYLSRYLPLMPEDYNLPNVMLTVFGAYFREKTAFCRIRFGRRRSGKNSIDLRKIIKIGWRALSDFRKIRRQLPPRPPARGGKSPSGTE